MNRTNNTQGRDQKSIPASVLLDFLDGFNSLPTIVPNGGSEEVDEQLIRWLQQKLLGAARRKKAA